MNRKRGVNNENKLLYDPNQRQQRRLGAFSMTQNNEEDELEETQNEEINEVENVENTTETNEKLENSETEQVASQAKAAAGAAVRETARNATKAAGTAAKKVAGKVAMKVLAFIVANPWILAILGVVLLIFILIIILGGGAQSENSLSSSYGASCSEISISTTSLSRSEFVSKVQDYFAYSNDADRRAFADNADRIYTIATNNGVNPELVVIRAILEGFSPGSSKNNYWGMGCTNTGGYNACISYESFDDGVLGYVENVSQYESVDAMMSRYAYIGSYWYNPGSSSVGGCYYFPYIKEFMTTSRANEVERICNSGNYCDTSGGEGCVATTEEDQAAYAKYQVSIMSDMRKTVFGIDPDNCEVYSADCTIYAQGDSKWGSTRLGNSSLTMADSGCAVTSIAIGISCSGTDVVVDNFDAKALIDTLNANGSCFTDSGAIYWGCSGIQEIAPSVRLVGTYNPSSSSATRELVESQDPNSTFVLLHYVNSAHPRGHYVVYTSTDGNYFITKDPSGGKVTSVLISEIDQVVVYSYDKEDSNE